jgi:uncharacterized protein (DUF2236 family)
MTTAVEPLGPDSITWRLVGDWRGLLLAGRILVMQVAHPVVGAGVGEHSVYKTDPYGRLDRTLQSTMAQVYGGKAAAEEGRRLQELHRDIRGVDAQGRRYSARNPEAFLWVHMTGFELGLVFHERFDTPLSPAQVQQLFDEWRRHGRILGIPDKALPQSVEEFWEVWARVSTRLENNVVVQDLLYNPPKPPPHVPALVFRPLSLRFLALRREVLAWTLPDALRESVGLPVLTVRQERKLRRLARLMRLLGRVLPERLLFLPVAWRARERALADLAKEPS